MSGSDAGNGHLQTGVISCSGGAVATNYDLQRRTARNRERCGISYKHNALF